VGKALLSSHDIDKKIKAQEGSEMTLSKSSAPLEMRCLKQASGEHRGRAMMKPQKTAWGRRHLS
jgi:hypothetical protein